MIKQAGCFLPHSSVSWRSHPWVSPIIASVPSQIPAPAHLCCRRRGRFAGSGGDMHTGAHWASAQPAGAVLPELQRRHVRGPLLLQQGAAPSTSCTRWAGVRDGNGWAL